MVWEVRPWRMLLSDERCLPSGVFGPPGCFLIDLSVSSDIFSFLPGVYTLLYASFLGRMRCKVMICLVENLFSGVVTGVRREGGIEVFGRGSVRLESRWRARADGWALQ